MFYVDTYKTPLHACALFLGACKKFGDRHENRFDMDLELPPTNYPIPSLRSISLVTYNLDRILNTYPYYIFIHHHCYHACCNINIRDKYNLDKNFP